MVVLAIGIVGNPRALRLPNWWIASGLNSPANRVGNRPMTQFSNGWIWKLKRLS